MPVIKSARKKLRQDTKRQKENSVFESAMKNAVKAAKKSPTAENVKAAFKAADKAVKKHIIHRNKASRIKSSLSKLAGSIPPVINSVTTPAKTTKKTPAKKKK